MATIHNDLSQTAAAAAMQAEIIALRAENAKVKEALNAKKSLKLKVGEKGGISLYGMGRFPVTLYVNQWEVVHSEAFRTQMAAFIAANSGSLKRKDD